MKNAREKETGTDPSNSADGDPSLSTPLPSEAATVNQNKIIIFGEQGP